MSLWLFEEVHMGRGGGGVALCNTNQRSFVACY